MSEIDWKERAEQAEARVRVAESEMADVREALDGFHANMSALPAAQNVENAIANLNAIAAERDAAEHELAAAQARIARYETFLTVIVGDTNSERNHLFHAGTSGGVRLGCPACVQGYAQQALAAASPEEK